MKRYMVTYQVQFTVKADCRSEVKERALCKVEAFLDRPDDLRTLLQTAVMDAEPIIKELKEVI